MWKKIREYDLYPKTADDVRIKTTSGAVISIISIVIAVTLLVSELRLYLDPLPVHDMTVDVSRGGRMRISMNVTFHNVPCDGLTLDVMDVTGEHRVDVSHDIYKTPVLPDGSTAATVRSEPGQDKMMQTLAAAMKKYEKPESYCGDCYGAQFQEGECCNSCADVKRAYARRGWAMRAMEEIEQCYREALERRFKNNRSEGCNLHGSLEVNKVAGNFHFAPGKSLENARGHVHDFLPFELEDFDVTHTIHHLNFGFEQEGHSNPLDGSVFRAAEGSADQKQSGLMQYFLKVVPTIVESNGETNAVHQFSVTNYFRPFAPGEQSVLPGVFFIYDLSPIMVRTTISRVPFAHFLTSVCAIVGGIISVAGLVDSIFFHGLRRLRKRELGKDG